MSNSILASNSFAKTVSCHKGNCVVLQFGAVYMRCNPAKFRTLAEHFASLYEAHRNEMNLTGKLLRLESDSSGFEVCLNAEELFLLKECVLNALLLSECEALMNKQS